MVFNFSKRDPLTGLALSGGLKNRVFRSRSAEGVLNFENFCRTLRNVFVFKSLYSKFAGFFGKALDNFIYVIIISKRGQGKYF